MLRNKIHHDDRYRGLAAKGVLTLVGISALVLAMIYLYGRADQGISVRRENPTSPSSAAVTPLAAITPNPLPVPPAPPAASVGLETDPAAQVQLVPEAFDFGVMKPGSINRRTLQLRNVSSVPMRIVGTKKTCSCTTVDMQPGLLQPGEEMPLTAIMAADHTPKEKNSVRVVVQYEGLAPTTIPIKGVISHAISTSPREIRVHPRGYADPAYRSSGTLTLRSLDGQPFRVLRSGGKPPVFMTPGETVETSALNHSIRWDVSDFDGDTGLNAEGDRLPPFWLIETDHPTSLLVEVAMNHKLDRIQQRGSCPWFTLDRRAVVEPVTAGKSAEFLLAMNGMLGAKSQDELINAVVSESDLFTTELVGIEPHVDGKRVNLRIQVTPAAGHRGPFMGQVQIQSPAYSRPFTVIGTALDPAKP